MFSAFCESILKITEYLKLFVTLSTINEGLFNKEENTYNKHSIKQDGTFMHDVMNSCNKKREQLKVNFIIS